eukprot:g3275.t1
MRAFCHYLWLQLKGSCTPKFRDFAMGFKRTRYFWLLPLVAWGAFSLSFLNNLAPTQRLPVQTLVSHADQQVLGPGRSTSSPSAIFVLGSLTILAAAKARPKGALSQ